MERFCFVTLKITNTLSMKHFLLPLFLLISSVTIAQHFEWGLGFSHLAPRGSMADNINAANGFNTSLGYRIPILGNKLVVSTEFGTARYGKKRLEQTFQNDVVQTPTNFMVNYINYVNNMHLNLRYEILKDKKIIPYVHMIGGRQTLGTRVRINVHEDQVGGDECIPLENDVTFRKRGLVWGYGGGLAINLLSQRDMKLGIPYVRLNFSVTQVQGGDIEYINVKQLQQVDAPPLPNDGSKEWAIPFTNINTNSIHNHTIARVYKSPLEQLQFRLGILISLAEFK
jgi:hypothetical protein